MRLKKTSVLIIALLIVTLSNSIAFGTISSFESKIDTFIASGTPDSTFWDQLYLYVGFDNIYGFGVERTLIYFEPTLPVQQKVNSAKLRLYYKSDKSINPNQLLSINVHPITSSSWLTSPYGPTWSNFGSGGIFDSATLSTLNVGGLTNTYFEWDVTTIVRNWIQNGVPNNGLLLKAVNENVSGDRAFQSLAFVGAPKLEINHETILNTSLSLKASPKTVKAGKAVTIKGQLKDSNGKPVAGKLVVVKANGKVIKRPVTNSGGVFKFKHKPKKTTKYTASYAGDASYQATNSKAAKVVVKKKAKKKKRR